MGVLSECVCDVSEFSCMNESVCIYTRVCRSCHLTYSVAQHLGYVYCYVNLTSIIHVLLLYETCVAVKAECTTGQCVHFINV